jgi:hypothetical protein
MSQKSLDKMLMWYLFLVVLSAALKGIMEYVARVGRRSSALCLSREIPIKGLPIIFFFFQEG